MANNPEPPADGRPGWPRFTPEQIEEGRRYGLELDRSKCIDLSDVVNSILAEMEAGDGPAAPPGGRP